VISHDVTCLSFFASFYVQGGNVLRKV
jgi:hypothetical protein